MRIFVLVILMMFSALSYSENKDHIAFYGSIYAVEVKKIDVEGSNACGRIFSKYENVTPIIGELNDTIEVFTPLGEWCDTYVKLPYSKYFSIAKKTNKGWKERYSHKIRSDEDGVLYITPFYTSLHLDCAIESNARVLRKRIPFYEHRERYKKDQIQQMVEQGFLVEENSKLYITKGIQMTWLKKNINNLECF